MFAVCSVCAARSLAQGPGGGPTPVSVTEIQLRTVPASVRLVGTLGADRSAIVASEIEGIVDVLKIDNGQAVAAGEIICELDRELVELELAEAKARLESLRAELQELENGTRAEELKRSEAAVAEARAMFEKWEFERNRVAELAKQGRSSAKEQHDTEMEFLAAQRRLTQEEARLEMAVNGPRQEEIAAKRFEVAAQEEAVRRLQRNVEKSRIRAPFNGIVVEKRTELGEWLDRGGAVCELVAIDRVRIRVDVPESAIRYARVGEEATYDVEALGETDARPISRVIPKATPSARTFPVEIDVPNENHRLLPGMFAWVNVPCGPSGERLMVSKDAIVARGREKNIFVVRPGPEGTMAMPVPVVTGIEMGEMIEIQGPGLSAGDQAVSRANERLHGPTPVTVQNVLQPTAAPAASPGDGSNAAVASPPPAAGG